MGNKNYTVLTLLGRKTWNVGNKVLNIWVQQIIYTRQKRFKIMGNIIKNVGKINIAK